eukprot:9077314-Alexandrium_andersonii.AAC.1
MWANSRQRSMSSSSTTFASVSAGLRSPGHLRSSKSPARTRSWTHSCATAKRRTRPTPARRQTPT